MPMTGEFFFPKINHFQQLTSVQRKNTSSSKFAVNLYKREGKNGSVELDVLLHTMKTNQHNHPSSAYRLVTASTLITKHNSKIHLFTTLTNEKM